LNQGRGQNAGDQADQGVGGHLDELSGQILAEQFEGRSQQANADQKRVEN